jgi:hypothetical protein
MTYFESKNENLPSHPNEQLAILFERGAFLLREIRQKHQKKNHQEFMGSFNKIFDIFFTLPLVMEEPQWIAYFSLLQTKLCQLCLRYDTKTAELLEQHFKEIAKMWRDFRPLAQNEKDVDQ